MAKKKQKIKITEIKPKIKEIKSVKKESKLEEEIDSAESESAKKINSSENEFTSSILSSGQAQSQQSPVESPVSATATQQRQQRNDPEFSQNRLYSTNTRQTSNVSEDIVSRYLTPEQAARRINPSINSSSIGPSQQNRRGDFASPELSKLRGENKEHNYSEILPEPDKKPKKRYPWEV